MKQLSVVTVTLTLYDFIYLEDSHFVEHKNEKNIIENVYSTKSMKRAKEGY